MSGRCTVCGLQQDDLPDCLGMEAPWRDLVPQDAFAERVELTPDQCVVDERAFFIRGHIEIPILGLQRSLSYSVWSSLSEQSFRHMGQRWNAKDRADDPAYFGWLSNAIPGYPETLHLQLSVQSRVPGLTPLFTVRSAEHPLAIEQQQGITVARWHQIVHEVLHTG